MAAGIEKWLSDRKREAAERAKLIEEALAAGIIVRPAAGYGGTVRVTMHVDELAKVLRMLSHVEKS